MIIRFGAVPITSESFLVGTACSVALTTANYAVPTTGMARGLIANEAFISVENANIRFKMNGSAPATACGHLVLSGDYLSLTEFAQMRNFQMLNEGSAATAYVHITYFFG